MATTPEPGTPPRYTSEQLAEITVDGDLSVFTRPVVLVDYDPGWPALYQREADRIVGLLGDRVLRLEHVGSTSVPGLAAKPVIDIALEVADSAAEADYVPALTAAGYRLVVREPDWYEHRYFKGPDTNINLHVFSAGSPMVDKDITFRDWLRSHDADRDLYARTKRELASREWTYVQQYADAKTDVIMEILRRARAGA
jgi:GrpB-like predicted nucleotidyltransferase (UPF0157 family)